MELSRLKELTEQRNRTEAALIEAKATNDMDGIRSVVTDALDDLNDKLGTKGNLAALFKSSGASKLDTKKDTDGKNILKQIQAKTAQYRADMKKLLDEADMLVSMVSEGQLNEAKANDYSDSSEFTDEFHTLASDIDKMKAVIKAPRWMDWMKSTDSNYGTDAVTPARRAITALNDLDVAIGEVEDELDDADSQ